MDKRLFKGRNISAEGIEPLYELKISFGREHGSVLQVVILEGGETLFTTSLPVTYEAAEVNFRGVKPSNTAAMMYIFEEIHTNVEKEV
jgi:hypothetical protein